MSFIEDKLGEMGLSLPELSPPVANYLPAIATGNLVFMSGHVPRNPDGSLIVGRVGDDMSVDEAYEIARHVTLSLLASLKQAIGNLDKVNRIVRVFCMVNSTAEFSQHPAVANGASDLLVSILGESGKHSRIAAGMGSLPGGVPVEIELIVELKG